MSSLFKLGCCSVLLVAPLMVLFNFGPLDDPAISSGTISQGDKTLVLCDRAAPTPPTGCIPVKYINNDGSSPDVPNRLAD